ncbi:hypothetical protein V6N11_053635 [Hibiscus sabdariffa]|uniref:Uncharacterized protein n=2 Tax=Hibiscus sabdariffa TaxID=183260 RepID=A0ABR2N772_9ROSI
MLALMPVLLDVGFRNFGPCPTSMSDCIGKFGNVWFGLRCNFTEPAVFESVLIRDVRGFILRGIRYPNPPNIMFPSASQPIHVYLVKAADEQLPISRGNGQQINGVCGEQPARPRGTGQQP